MGRAVLFASAAAYNIIVTTVFYMLQVMIVTGNKYQVWSCFCCYRYPADHISIIRMFQVLRGSEHTSGNGIY